MPGNVWPLIASVSVMVCAFGTIMFFSHHYTLDGIKSRTVGDGQHGTARWATKGEIAKAFRHVVFRPALWRKGKNLPTDAQGLILGSEGKKNAVTAVVDCDDVHCLMIGASGIGKTAFFVYYESRLLNYAFEGVTGFEKMQNLMNGLRTDPPGEIAGYAVEKCVDYKDSNKTGLPGSNVLRYFLAGWLEATVRPSGTEPKLKVYLTAVGKDRAESRAVAEKLTGHFNAWSKS